MAWTGHSVRTQDEVWAYKSEAPLGDMLPTGKLVIDSCRVVWFTDNLEFETDKHIDSETASDWLPRVLQYAKIGLLS